MSFDIPPQEVRFICIYTKSCITAYNIDCGSVLIAAFDLADPDQRLSDGVSGRRGVLPHPLPHLLCGQRVQRTLLHTAAGSDHPEERTRYQEPGRTAV